MISKRSIGLLFLLSISMIFGLSNGCQKDANDIRIPILRPGNVWISSIPIGLQVYFAPDPSNDKVERKEGWAQMFDKTDNPHFLLSQQNLKGVTPVLLNKVLPGKYLMGIEPVDFLEVNKGTGLMGDRVSIKNLDPTLKAMALVTPLPLVSPPSLFQQFQEGKFKGGSVIYSFTKRADAGDAIIMLTSTDMIDRAEILYPEGVNYELDEAKLAKELNNSNLFTRFFSAADVEKGLAFLHRGGKVIIGDENTQFVIEMISDQSWKITPQIKGNE